MDTTSLPARIAQSRRHLVTRESLPEACDATVRYIEADHTGLPMRREELVGRKGKAPDGTAKTRMAVLGCVFTQHGLDEQGQPLRDHQSTTYLAGFESPTDFGSGLRHEALRRGMDEVEKIVFLVDGTLALEKMGRDLFSPSH